MENIVIRLCRSFATRSATQCYSGKKRDTLAIEFFVGAYAALTEAGEGAAEDANRVGIFTALVLCPRGFSELETIVAKADATKAEAEAEAAGAPDESKPAELNGYPVVRCQHHTNGYSTVMVDRGPDYPDCRHVVATWWPTLGQSWSWGHYIEGRMEADARFAEVAERNWKRAGEKPEAPLGDAFHFNQATDIADGGIHRVL